MTHSPLQPPKPTSASDGPELDADGNEIKKKKGGPGRGKKGPRDPNKPPKEPKTPKEKKPK